MPTFYHRYEMPHNKNYDAIINDQWYVICPSGRPTELPMDCRVIYNGNGLWDVPQDAVGYAHNKMPKTMTHSNSHGKSYMRREQPMRPAYPFGYPIQDPIEEHMGGGRCYYYYCGTSHGAGGYIRDPIGRPVGRPT